MTTRIEKLHEPSKAKLKEQISTVEKALNTIATALNSCQEIQDDYKDKKLTQIQDLQELQAELRKTAERVLYKDFMES